MTWHDVAESRGGARTYQRQEGEYVRPEAPLHVVSWDEARDVPLHTSGKLTGRSFYWGGVRGSKFVDGTLWPYALDVEHELWGELVPEPFNPHDSTAVAIDVDGIRAGYMSRTAASYIHRHVAALVATGNRVLTPVRFSIVPTHSGSGLQVDAYAAFPTFTGTERHLPSQAEYLAILGPLWAQLDDQVRHQIAEDGFHLTEDTLAAVVALRGLAPMSGLTEHTHLRSVPRGIELFLEAARRKHTRDKRAQEQERRDAQLQRLLSLRRQGHTYAAIGRQEGLAASTVSRRLNAVGDPLRRTGAAKKTQRPRTSLAGGRRPLSSSVIRTMQMLHENGWTAERLAKDHGRDLAEVKAALSQETRRRT